MKTITLTAEEYRILIFPTRIELWGAQQEVARKVEVQVRALNDDSRTVIDSFDILVIQKANEALYMGGYVPTGAARSGGWPLSEWTVGCRQLKREMGIRIC